MNIKAAQEELSASYANGAMGVAVSGVVWLASGIAALVLDVRLAMAVLFFLVGWRSTLYPRLSFGRF